MSDAERRIDEGEVLARCVREDDAELRVALRSYEGHAYVDVRLWVRSKGGALVPSRKGCSIRGREIHDVVAALALAGGRLGGGADVG